MTNVSIEGKTVEQLVEEAINAGPSDRVEIFLQILEEEGVVREALKGLLLVVDKVDCSIVAALKNEKDGEPLSETDEAFYSGLVSVREEADKALTTVRVLGAVPHIESWL